MTALVHESAREASASQRSASAQALLDRLDDPRTADALHSLLDNAELLAFAATMVDGVLRRSETITGNLADSLGEVRASAAAAGVGSLDELKQVLPALTAALPALQALMASSLVQPGTITTLDTVTASLTEGLAEARTAPPTGLRSLVWALRDPDTARGLSALLGVARSLGRRSGR